jgi:hypothetical protein
VVCKSQRFHGKKLFVIATSRSKGTRNFAPGMNLTSVNRLIGHNGLFLHSEIRHARRAVAH